VVFVRNCNVFSIFPDYQLLLTELVLASMACLVLMTMILCRVCIIKLLYLEWCLLCLKLCLVLSGMVHTRVEVCRMDLWNDLGFSLCAALSVYHVVATSDEGKKVWVGVSTDWCVAIEHQRLSSIRDYLHRLSD